MEVSGSLAELSGCLAADFHSLTAGSGSLAEVSGHLVAVSGYLVTVSGQHTKIGINVIRAEIVNRKHHILYLNKYKEANLPGDGV